jgi:hypothetical protein
MCWIAAFISRIISGFLIGGTVPSCANIVPYTTHAHTSLHQHIIGLCIPLYVATRCDVYLYVNDTLASCVDPVDADT